MADMGGNGIVRPMPRELWLLRHGTAEPGNGKPDEERELNQRGERESEAAGRALAELGVEFDLALTSPRVRAKRTAELAAKALGVQPSDHTPLSKDFEADEARALLEGQDDGARVLLVGHDPDFTQVVLDLTGARVKLRKGGVAAIRLDGRAGELLALLAPRELDAIAGEPDERDEQG